MTTLANGVVIEEHITAHNYTPAADCLAVFGYPPEKVGATIHHWGNDGQDFDDVVAYLASDNPRGSSATFVLQEDRVSCIVSPDDASWHGGHPFATARTIGIECRPEMTPGDLRTLGFLLEYLEGIYGSLVIYLHFQWVATACPGRYAGQIDAIVADVNNVEVAPAPPVDNGPLHDCCCHD